MQRIFENFIEELKNSLKHKLKSVILYGSKASQEDTKYSDYNILIIVDNLTIEDLKLIGKTLVNWASKFKSPLPLIFDTKEFFNSVDVFPIEFLDIKQNHKVLYGEDILEKLNVDTKNLRHQCELELKSKLLKLRQVYILTKGKKTKLKKLLIETISTFLVLFKTVIQLAGQKPPEKKYEVLNLIKEVVNINTQPFEKILHLKQNKKEAKTYNVEDLFKQYITEIEKVIDFVDKF